MLTILTVACTPSLPPSTGAAPAAEGSAATASTAATGTTGNSGSTASSADTAPLPDEPANILILLLDDVGASNMDAYGIGTVVPSTPTFDQLASDGLRFRYAFANPVCSPTRATIQTGRYAWRTGITDALHADGGAALALDETTLPELTAGAGYDASYVGKWHLGSRALDYESHPNDSGWPYFSGMLAGMSESGAVDRLPQGYWDWVETTNGVSARTTVYQTTETTDDAIARMQAMSEPWLLMVSYFAAHNPVHWPPAGMASRVPTGATEQAQQYHAMIESLDSEVGRLLDAMTPIQQAQTTVILLGDNGAWEQVISPPLPAEGGKDTPYDNGARVPLIVRGPHVAQPGSVSDALVNTTDLYATVAELAGVTFDPAERDTVSLLPYLQDPTTASVRTHVLTELFAPPDPGLAWTSGFRTLRDSRYKLVEHLDGTEELYDMQGADWEGPDLLSGSLTPAEQAALDALRAAWPYPLP